MMTVRSLAIHIKRYRYIYIVFLLGIQVFLKRTFLETKEFEGVIIPVGFSPQKTTIPFTVRIETFDLTPPDAQGLVE